MQIQSEIKSRDSMCILHASSDTLQFTIYVFVRPQAMSAKSLLEIQQEQARQLERERQKREENQQISAKVLRWQTFCGLK